MLFPWVLIPVRYAKPPDVEDEVELELEFRKLKLIAPVLIVVVAIKNPPSLVEVTFDMDEPAPTLNVKLWPVVMIAPPYYMVFMFAKEVFVI